MYNNEEFFFEFITDLGATCRVETQMGIVGCYTR